MRLPIALTVVLAMAGSANAGSHLWVISEVFSNADGTIQFVEMHESTGSPNEVGIGSKWISSMATSNQVVFPMNLPPGSTANQYLLVATAGFAALPGAPTPDLLMPDNFFNLTADTLQFWLYTTSPLTFSAGSLPLDGLNSWNRGTPAFAAVNSPTNFAGVTGSVDASPSSPPDFVRCDANQDGGFNIADAISILGFLFSGASVDCMVALDCNDDGQANIADAVAGLDSLFGGGSNPMAPFPTCGQDPTLGGALSCTTFAACP
ncbi:MAG: hypothetical protein AB7O52_10540 [Planctomycetota bacterium]